MDTLKVIKPLGILQSAIKNKYDSFNHNLPQNKNSVFPNSLKTQEDLINNNNSNLESSFNREENVEQLLSTSLNLSNLLNFSSSICSTSPSTSSATCSSKSTKRDSTTSLNVASNLPPGWEVRVNSSGRYIYLDHVNKLTTWHPPAILETNYFYLNSSKEFALF